MTTAWPRVVAKCAEVGVSFDGWQHGLGSIALGKRADGKYAATVGGVVLSIPRQVGKTFLVGMIIIALCLIHPGLTVLWTAHRTRTATKTFSTLKAMTARKKIAAHMLEPRNANGEQEIRFRNGSVIMFGAREQGFGRGFDEVDVEVFDEAQILTEKGLEDMVPAANQSRQAAGALLFFMGTPPRPTDPGEEFRNRRKKALSGAAKNMVYVEFSADEDAVLDDHKQWAKANPSFPHRTPIESMERMRENLTDDDSFRREGLGIWDREDDGSGVVDMKLWAACGAEVEPVSDPIVLAVETTGDLSMTTLVTVGTRPDGLPQVEVVQQAPDTGWVPGRVAQIVADNDVKAVVLDEFSSAKVLIDDLTAALEPLGLELTKANTANVGLASQSMLKAITEGSFRHVEVSQAGARPLTNAVRPAETRPLGDGAWAWSRKKTGPAIAPLVAATLGLWKWRDLASSVDALSQIW